MASQLQITPIDKTEITISIVGTSPMIQHCWSEKGLRQMRLSAADRRKQKKEARDPEAEADASSYKTADGQHGFPLLAFKASLISAAHKDIGLEKTLVRKSLFIKDRDRTGVVPMECSTPFVREDVVRVGAGAADLRYRPQFDQWGATITLEVDAEKLCEQDLVNLVNRAGFGVGICEWRPEKGGEFGRFEVDVTKPITTKRM